MKAILSVFLLFFAIVLVSGYLYLQSNPEVSDNFVKTTQNNTKDDLESKRSIKVGGTTVYVDVADTNESRAKGLSGVPSLEENQGMLFVFQNKTYPKFWMKEMLINLDLIWITDNKVIKIHENVPAPNPETPLLELERYSPSEAVNYVLEVNAGFSAKNGITVGDNVDTFGL